MQNQDYQAKFLQKNKRYGVVGVSQDQSKWGYRVYDHLKREGYTVVPINPKYEEIDGERCFARVSDVPGWLDVVVTVVPPQVTEKVALECAREGVGAIWMQPGSESEEAIRLCEEKGIEVVANACLVRDGLKQSFTPVAR